MRYEIEPVPVPELMTPTDAYHLAQTAITSSWGVRYEGKLEELLEQADHESPTMRYHLRIWEIEHRSRFREWWAIAPPRRTVLAWDGPAESKRKQPKGE